MASIRTASPCGAGCAPYDTCGDKSLRERSVFVYLWGPDQWLTGVFGMDDGKSTARGPGKNGRHKGIIVDEETTPEEEIPEWT